MTGDTNSRFDDSGTPRSIFKRRLVTVPQFASLICYTPRGAWNLVYQGRLGDAVIRFSGRVLIDLNKIEDMLDAGTAPAIER